MSLPAGIDRTRATNHRRAWIGFGVTLLVCSASYGWFLLEAKAAQEAAIRGAHPWRIVGSYRDPLEEIKLWTCGINALAGVGIIVRGLLIRPPGA